MENRSIINIDYRFTINPYSERQCVEVHFLYREKPTKRLIYFKTQKNFNYIKEAKRIIKKELANGDLIKYAKKYHNIKVHRYVGLKIAVAILFVGAVSLAGLFTWKTLNNGSGGYKPGDVVDVVVDAKDQKSTAHTLTLTKTSATVGEKYESDIKLSDQDVVTYSLPDALDSITSDNKPIQKGDNGYTYSLIAPNVAHISIIESCVIGPINMKLTLLTNVSKPIMSVDQIDNCVVSYIDGEQMQELEVGMQLEVKLGTIEFICMVKGGYRLDNDCFALIDTSGQPLAHTYSQNKLTVIVTGSFSFKVKPFRPQPTFTATVTYTNKCTGVYVSSPQGEMKIESGTTVIVTLKEGNKLEFAVDVAAGMDALTSQEVTCSLAGVVITVSKTPTLAHPYLLTLDCSSSLMSSFSLDIHPGILSPVNVTATWTNCFSVKDQTGKELTSGVPQAISPAKRLGENNPLIALTVAVSDGELDTTDITGLETLTDPEIRVLKSYELSNVYEVQIFCANFVDFSVGINPHPLGPTIDVTVSFNNMCTVSYGGEEITTSGTTIAATQEYEEDQYTITFEVVTENIDLSLENIYSSPYNVIIEHGGSGDYDYTVKIVNTTEITGPVTIDIRPGEVRATLVFDDKVSVSYGEQEVTTNIPLFVEALNADATIQFDVQVEEGFYITGDCISFDPLDYFNVIVDPDVPWEYTVTVSIKDSMKSQGWKGFTMEIIEEPVAAIDITIDANVAITEMYVKKGGEDTKIIDWKLEDFTPENVYTDFIVYTDGTELTSADVSIDLTHTISYVARVADGIYTLGITVPSVDLWDDYTISIKPSLDLTIATTANPTNNHYSITRGGTSLSESPTDITYTNGTYTYAYDVTFDQYYTLDECAVYYKVGEGDPIPIAQESISYADNQLTVTFPEAAFRNITLIDIQISAKWNTTVTMNVTYNTTDFELLDATQTKIETGAAVDITEPVTTLYLHVLNSDLLPDFDPTSGIPRYFIEITGNATFTIDPLDGDVGYFEVKVTTSPSVSNFTITIVNPAVLILYDESKGTFADYRLKERMNENFGKDTHAFDFYPGTYDQEHRIDLIEASDPDLTIVSYVYEPYASMGYGSITFNKQITQGMRVTIDITPIY